MKKIIFPLLFILALGFTSCKKCATCIIKSATFTTPEEEFCGTSDEVDAFIQEQKDKAMNNGTIGARAECTRH